MAEDTKMPPIISGIDEAELNEVIFGKHMPIIDLISDVQEVDPKTHPRGEPVVRDDIIQRADKLFNMGAMILCDRIAELEGQLRCEGEHTAAGQARIEDLERQLADARRNATTG